MKVILLHNYYQQVSATHVAIFRLVRTRIQWKCVRINPRVKNHVSIHTDAFVPFKIQGAYKLSEDFAKPYFHKYWTEIHDVTTIWKRNVCSFIVTLNAFNVRPTCDTADIQTILPFPPNPPKHVLCDVPDCGVDVLSQFWQCFWMWWDVNIVLDETPQEEITHCQVWWPGWPGAEGVVCGRCTTNPSTWHVFI